ncbi:hypothetical protein M422DRAFT_67364 [Sphaerobolus stellatus SS14]|uniref:Golgi to ER traffic protein 2 n=1 Tax=Sphaerobolus stellatus (strain SS14) TaxID=990650 RepID=A0A0C9W2G6_SPHS4|nr:hypothetical protein M422DRAFT_67364 [Sphaerobolus stellatus SS14]
MSAAARAKARREAILGSRGDRLAKLTSSARGEDPEGIYAQAPGSSLKNFVGEESTLPSPPASTSKSQTGAGSLPSPRASPSPQPQRQTQNAEMPPMPEWGAEQQELFRALLSGAGGPGGFPGAPGGSDNPQVPQDPFAAFAAALSGGQAGGGGFPGAPPSITGGSNDSQIPQDPFSALAAAFSGGAGGAFAPLMTAPKPKSFIQKILPLLHLLSMLGLLLWFVGFVEPQAYEASGVVHATVVGRAQTQWGRWAALAKGRADPAGIVIAQLPTFFWAFTTIELILHSLRLFTGAVSTQYTSYSITMLIGTE